MGARLRAAAQSRPFGAPRPLRRGVLEHRQGEERAHGAHVRKVRGVCYVSCQERHAQCVLRRQEHRSGEFTETKTEVEVEVE